ncbi:RNA polymerase II-associated protein [Coprinopsis marcescibilis]|uniref:RNA polymerase II-associated protein n=1 Tax=Coprinopsis marcescibilis TaxID=230819 RepID=A0A5C3KZV3_COPMA|nr:RNA polymerase II-associated protein [Coprinopsis marcescibilis]
MSLKKSAKLDLLVRVRYTNPIPPPPCPPKLLVIPTNPMRYARPEFLNAVASEMPLPMIVDAECGMPLDLSQWESLWEEGADDSCTFISTIQYVTLNPDPNNLPRVDPKDAFLLGDPSSSSSAYANGSHAGPPQSSSNSVGNVTWLRRTEYLSRESGHRLGALESKSTATSIVDISREAQLATIEASFKTCNDESALANLRHPNNPNLVAVESYPILPDSDIWSNQYDLFRFSERPGERPADVPDERLDCAILRPMKTEFDSFLAYYLTPDDEAAVKLKEIRASLAPYEIPDDQEETVFNFVRDFEAIKVEQEVPNEFLLVLQEEEDIRSLNDSLNDLHQLPRKEKGAYYKNIERKMLLKKRRANVGVLSTSQPYPADLFDQQYEQYDDKWEVIRVKYAPMSKEEEEERQEALAEVADPMYLLNRDADGEIEVDESGAAIFSNGGIDF